MVEVNCKCRKKDCRGQKVSQFKDKKYDGACHLGCAMNKKK
jgi:hypothetical protein